MESFATPYPVSFNDGEQELDKGVLGIHGCLTLKRFQSMIGAKTGLPPAQLACVFVCKRTVGGVEKKQRIPINENTNFAIILAQHNPLKEKDCFFLVSLKKSKKERKASKKRADSDDALQESKDSEAASSGESSPHEVSTEDEEPQKSVDCESTAEREKPEHEPGQQTEKLSAGAAAKPNQDPAAGRKADKQDKPQDDAGKAASVWNQGSLAQKLVGKDATHVQPRPGQKDALSDAPRVAPSPCAGCSEGVGASGNVQHSCGARAAVTLDGIPISPSKIERVSGSSSPTSVLDPALLRKPGVPPVPPAHMGIIGEGAFHLFGSDFRGMELKSFLQEAARATMHCSQAPKWCKFCAFCRERNLGSAPFHWCPDDQVVPGLRGPNPAGPIGKRMMKQRLAAA